MNKRAYEVWQLELSNKEKTDILNKEFGKGWKPRTWQQRAKNYGDGLIDGIKETATEDEMERLAKARIKAMKEQKIAILMKQPIHKATRKMAMVELVKRKLKEDFDYPEFVLRKTKNTRGKRLVEVIIADIQFKGGKDEVDWVNHIFSKAVDEMYKIDIRPEDEFRVVMLGDDIEGDNAHESTLNEVHDLKVGQTRGLFPLLVNGINTLMSLVKTENKSLVFVPYSNHGLAYSKGKARYQYLEEDLGLVLYDFLKLGLDKDIYIFEPDHHRMVVETPESIYYHGHLGYNKNPRRNYEVLGLDKDLDAGHLHHYEEKQERNRTVTLFSTCRRDYVRYEKSAGYKVEPEIAIRIRENKDRTVRRVKL